ncbi:MAG: hypothetical protein OXH12_12950 [Chloroflexi bacterium]|nr:hypothetical protein [Chloroflexota bacterium]
MDSPKGVGSALDADIDEGDLRRTCGAIAALLDGAAPEDQDLVLETVQLQITATRDEVTLEGVLPVYPPESIRKPSKPYQNYQKFVTIEQTSA